MVSNQIKVSVNFPPKFLDSFENLNVLKNVVHGKGDLFSCETEENPKGVINWYFTPKSSIVKVNLDHREKVFELLDMNEEKQGEYECVVENSVGRVKRSFDVVDFPRG